MILFRNFIIKYDYYFNIYYATVEIVDIKRSDNSDLDFIETDGIYKITDDGRFYAKYDVVNLDKYFSISLATMKQLGYKYVTIDMNLTMREKNRGYQGVLIYDGPDKDAKLLAWSGDIEYGGSGSPLKRYSTREIPNLKNIDIDSFDEKYNGFVIRYGAHGFFNDTWYNKKPRVELIFSKNPL